MEIYKLIGDFCAQNTFIVANGSRCFLVDCGVSAKVVFAALKQLGLTAEALLLTHGHFDHIIGAAECQRAGIKVYISEKDNGVVNSSANGAKLVGGYCKRFSADVLFKGGEELEIAGIKVSVISTPGHTVGGVCYAAEDKLFSGDTLFPLSFGRTDLPTGNFDQLRDSIVNKLFLLPEHYEVYCGHSDFTSRQLLLDKFSDTFLYRASADSILSQEIAENPIKEY